MAWVSILTPRCTLEFRPRHDGTARASVFDPNTYANTKPGSAIAAVSTHRLIQGDLISQGFFGSSISDMHCQCRRSDFENLVEARIICLNLWLKALRTLTMTVPAEWKHLYAGSKVA